MWLSERDDVPLIGMVSRLTSQKGLDLVRCVLTALMDHNDVQFAVLGTGDRAYEDFFTGPRLRIRDASPRILS